ncbi:D-ser-dehydrat domain-containing protein [Mycena kentingensis (nom. inval.)]|nr:D-ser-dehydrat domain-containing protein [Mycena kentingensis (nom. inval.)]
MSLASARAALDESVESADLLAQRIDTAETNLKRVLFEGQAAIAEMNREVAGLRESILHLRAYLAPIRRLPGDVLSELFFWCFEDHVCVGWVLAQVCATWRRQALAMPRLWTKIRLFTSQASSPDSVRLWLERAGSTAPLDIEIYLRVVHASCEAPPPPPNQYPRPRRRHDLPLAYIPPPAQQLVSGIQQAPHFTPRAVPPIVAQHPAWESPASGPGPSPAEAQWGHIALYYLVKEMHRWERFVFRFEKGFASLAALKAISGDAPILKEFEVSCAAPSYYSPEWSWLPTSAPLSSSSSRSTSPLPALESLTLQYTPFRPTSPLFLHPDTHLHTLVLRALPAATVPLDQCTLRPSRRLSSRSPGAAPVNTQNGNPAGLNPANQLDLSNLEELHFGGHHLVTTLVDTLLTPQLHTLEVDVDAPREPIEETIVGLIGRSAGCVLKSLAIGYGAGGSALRDMTGCSSSGLYSSTCSSSSASQHALSLAAPPSSHGGSSLIAWTFLTEVGANLEVLKAGGGAVDGLLSALVGPDDGGGFGFNMPPPGTAGFWGGLGLGALPPPPPGILQLPPMPTWTAQPQPAPAFAVNAAGAIVPLAGGLNGITLPPITFLPQAGTGGAAGGLVVNIALPPPPPGITVTTVGPSLPALPTTLPPLIGGPQALLGGNANANANATTNGWLCPNLKELYLRGCPGHHPAPGSSSASGSSSTHPFHSPHPGNYISPYASSHNAHIGANHGLGFAAASSSGSLGLGLGHGHGHGLGMGMGSGGGGGAGMEGVMRVVRVVEGRNPVVPVGNWGNGSGLGSLGVQRLTKLELEDCSRPGAEVVKWLGERVGKGVWVGVTGARTDTAADGA